MKKFIKIAFLSLCISSCKKEIEISKPKEIEVLLPTAVFEIQERGVDSFFFYNKSLNASDYLWEFGDGSTSKEKYPYHAYKKCNVKNSTVKLIARLEEKSDSVSQVVNLIYDYDNINGSYWGKTYCSCNNGKYSWPEEGYNSFIVTKSSEKSIFVYNTEYKLTKLDCNTNSCTFSDGNNSYTYYFKTRELKFWTTGNSASNMSGSCSCGGRASKTK